MPVIIVDETDPGPGYEPPAPPAGSGNLTSPPCYYCGDSGLDEDGEPCPVCEKGI